MICSTRERRSFAGLDGGGHRLKHLGELRQLGEARLRQIDRGVERLTEGGEAVAVDDDEGHVVGAAVTVGEDLGQEGLAP